jgi:hypothetical protein
VPWFEFQANAVSSSTLRLAVAIGVPGHLGEQGGASASTCTENRRPKLSVLPAIDQPSAMLKDELLHGSGQRQRESD